MDDGLLDGAVDIERALPDLGDSVVKTTKTAAKSDASAEKGGAGVTFVACDANGGSTIVYAGVYDTIGSTGGIWCSTDGGTSWAKVGGTAVSTPNKGQGAPNARENFRAFCIK